MRALALIALALQTQQAPVRVSATLTQDDIVIGETTMLVIEVHTTDGSAERIDMPTVPAGLEIVATEEVTETRAGFPGGQTRVMRRTVVLTARVVGQFTIPAVRVRAAGREWTSAPLSLVVRGAPVGEHGLEESRIDVVLRPTRAYVGQQIILEATASFVRGLRARQTRPATYQAPSPAGFWIHDLPDPLTVGLRTIGGGLYEAQTFRRAYFPLMPGTFTLPPAQLTFEFRRGFLGATETRALVSDSPTIVVLPVPEANRPAAYRGAVGRFTIQGAISARRVRAGEATTLVVDVSGNGNVKALPAPLLDVPDGLDVHPPTEDATVTVDGDRVGGTKRFTWVLVPERSGTLELPPVEYAFFDPERAAYAVVRTGALSLEVDEAGPAVADARLAPFARAPSRARTALRSPALPVALSAPLLLMGAAWLARRRRPFERRSRRTALSPLARLARMRRDTPASADAGFHADLLDVIRGALDDRLGGGTAGVSAADALRMAAHEGGLPADAAAALREVLDAVERARFSDAVPDRAERHALLQRTETALRAIERRRIGRAVPLGLLLVLLLPGGGASVQQDAGAWERGVAAFARGDHTIAADAFAEAAASRPGDANTWLALGNALYRTGRHPEATRSWLRAARLDPRLRAARANLDLVLEDPVQEFLPVGFALSWAQAAWLFIAGWWVTGVWGALLLWQDRRPVPAVTPVAVAAILALACGLAGRAVPAAAVSLDRAPLLADPVLKAETIGVVGAGMVVTILDRQDGWLRVRARQTEGWVEARLLGDV